MILVGTPGHRFAFMMATAMLLTACGAEQPPQETEVKVKAQLAEPVIAEQPAGPEVDPDSGLVIDEGWELVRGHCAACHSVRLVTQNRGTRDTWEGMIRWMQETQGLWPLDPVTEGAILDYLARNYAPRSSARRAPLPPELMPANPYELGSSP